MFFRQVLFKSIAPGVVRHHFIFLIFPLLLGWFAGPAFSEEKDFDLQVYLTKKEALEIAFPGADEVVKEKKWLTDEQRDAIGKICHQKIDEKRITFYIGKKNGQAMGAMVIDHVIGKSFPITFMVVLNLDGTVRAVEIMIYREPRGWEVRYKSFLRQFSGRDAASDFREIHSITGATLSVRAVTRGVYKATAAYKVLVLDATP